MMPDESDNPGKVIEKNVEMIPSGVILDLFSILKIRTSATLIIFFVIPPFATT